MNLDDNISQNIKEDVDKLIQNEKFSPKRKVFLTSNSEVTKAKDFDEIVMFLLRLGFDIELSTKNFSYNKTLNEILKTSYSEITFDITKIPIISHIQKTIIKQNYNKEKLGKIIFN